MGAMAVLWSFLGVLKHLLAPPLRCPCLLRLKKKNILHLFLGVPAATVGGTGTPVATTLPRTVLHTYFLLCAHALKWPRPQVWVFGQGQCQVMTFENITILSQQKEIGMEKKRH